MEEPFDETRGGGAAPEAHPIVGLMLTAPPQAHSRALSPRSTTDRRWRNSLRRR
jgi:hypothetical protein